MSSFHNDNVVYWTELIHVCWVYMTEVLRWCRVTGNKYTALFKILMTLSHGQYWSSENLPYQRMSCFTRLIRSNGTDVLAHCLLTCKVTFSRICHFERIAESPTRWSCLESEWASGAKRGKRKQTAYVTPNNNCRICHTAMA